MKKYILFLLVIFIGLALFVVALQKVGLENIISTISNFSLWKFSIILGLFLLDLCIGSFSWKIILKTQHLAPVKFSKIFIAKTIGATINYLTPCVFGGGEPFKAYVLKKETNIPLARVITSIIIEEVIFLSVTFIFFTLGVIILISYFNLPINLVFFLTGLTFMCLSILLFFYHQTINKNSDGRGFFIFLIEAFRLDKIKVIRKFKTNIANTEKDISYFFKHKKIELIKVSLLAVFEALLFIFSCWLIITFLGEKIDIKQIISINALINATYLIPIPASLGIFEISQAFIFSFFGLSLSSGIAFSLILRIMNLTLATIGIIFLIFFEMKIMAENIIQTTKTPIQKLIETFKNFRNPK